jgi:hypothetical protein
MIWGDVSPYLKGIKGNTWATSGETKVEKKRKSNA